MKKLLLAIGSVLLVAVVTAYFALPKQLIVAESVTVPNHARSVVRVLQEPQQWHKWWPGQIEGNRFFHGGSEFVLMQGMYNNTLVQIRSGKDSINSLITVVPTEGPSIVKWEYTTANGGAAQKLRNWNTARTQQRHMQEILEKLQAFASSDKNIYGLDITQQMVTDTVLVATRFQTAAYPNTADIYQHTNQLKTYIQQQAATETNHPMLHVSSTGNGSYETMVAIPTNRRLSGTSGIMQKHMVPGKILVATVKGGQMNVEEALATLDKYAKDKALKAPAIPFASLVTNRLQEPDSAKWITRVYYPIY